ncbi:MAG: 50S ribosomal protein L2 [Thermoproteota archaeon]|nr:50S ribosomal protein L2 [Thermoproteota archaeon]
MGKRIRAQRKGRGTSTFKSAAQKKVAPAQYPHMTKEEIDGVTEAEISQILHEPGRGAPLALLKLETGESYYTVVPEGTYKGEKIQLGCRAPIKIGNVLPVGKIPEGTMVCNIELSPNDGGKIARSSGSYATVTGHTPKGTIVKLPSGKTRYVNDLCRATIGVVSGGGRLEKPFLKAGEKFHLMRAKGKSYPRTRGMAMVAAAHPHGSSKRGAHKVRIVSHDAPPGQKVGLIAAKSSGRGKRRRKKGK